MFWFSSSSAPLPPGGFVIFRSRFQPVTIVHDAAIRNFFKHESEHYSTKPHLVLAIVGDLLRHTKLGDELSAFAKNGDSRYVGYLERHKPALNPLAVFSVVDDLATLIADLPDRWRNRIRITLMPDFACTMWAKKIHDRLTPEAYGILKELLPPTRSWFVPLLDNDDVSDVAIAAESNEDVFKLDSGELAWTKDLTFEAEHKDVGLYGYATYCLLKHDKEKSLSDLLPRPVRKRWKRDGVFAMVRETARQRAANLDELLDTLLASPNVKPFRKDWQDTSPPVKLGDFFQALQAQDLTENETAT